MKRWRILAPRSAGEKLVSVLQPQNYKLGVDTFSEYAKYKCKKCKRVEWARAVREGSSRKLAAGEREHLTGRGDCFDSTEGAIVISRALYLALSELAAGDIAAASIADDNSLYLIVPQTMVQCPLGAPFGKSLQDALEFMSSGSTPFLRKSLPCKGCSAFEFAFTHSLIDSDTTANAFGLLSGTFPYASLTIWLSEEVANALTSRNDVKVSFES